MRPISILCIFATMKIFAIVVTYNAEPWLERCFNSLRGSSVSLHTIVIDNFSTDNTCSRLESEFPEVELVRNSVNSGFGQANNMAFEMALECGADYVLLLNQDALIFEDTIEKLVEVAQKDSRAGILSPIHLDATEKAMDIHFERYISVALPTRPSGQRHNAARVRALGTQNAAAVHLRGGLKVKREGGEFGFSSGFGRGSSPGLGFGDPFDVPFVNAAVWLLPRKTLQKVGGFDPIFFHYGEDKNYAQRLIYHGLKTIVVPEARAVHDRREVILAATDKSRWLRSHLLIGLCNINRPLLFAAISLLPVFIKMLFLLIFGSVQQKANVRFGFSALSYSKIKASRAARANRGCQQSVRQS